MRFFVGSLAVLVAVFSCGCAMQRAAEAESAQKKMIGMQKESVFACMGIPKKKATEGETEIWSYKSGNGYTWKSKKSATTTFSGKIKNALTLGDETKESRFCTVQIVMKRGLVQAVNYNGPTGGLLTEDEQCAYAVRNCLK